MGKRKRYTSDLTDREWKRIEPLLPDAKPVGRTREIYLPENNTQLSVPPNKCSTIRRVSILMPST